jgi:uncharacterized protein
MKLWKPKTKTDANSIRFSNNLGQLLLAPPLGEKVLAIDPGFRSGCKIVCLDEKGIYCIMKPFIHL